MSVHTGTSVRDALQGAITAIAAAGCDTPRLDAEVLLADALGVRRERLLLDGDLEVRGDAVHRFRDSVRRRSVMREPVAYIVGRKHFRRLDLIVDGRALIPRPETELLVEAGLAMTPGTRVLDVGTGSGATALALKDERPDLDVWGSDSSEDALSLARANGQRLGLDVRWLQADLLSGIPDECDAVLSNPPYVPDGDRVRLAPEIVRYEPPQALFAGEDGLAVIARLLREAGQRPRIRTIALEVGAGQASAVRRMSRAAGFAEVESLRDLAQIERVVVGRR